MVFCPGCGTQQPVNDGHARFCFQCGYPLPTAAAAALAGHGVTVTSGRLEQQNRRVANGNRCGASPPPQTSSRRSRSAPRSDHYGLRPPYAVGPQAQEWRTTAQDAAAASAERPAGGASGASRRQGRAVVQTYLHNEAVRSDIFPDALPQPSTPPGLRRRREERDRLRRGTRCAAVEEDPLTWEERVLKVTKTHANRRNGLVLDDSLQVVDVEDGSPAYRAGVRVGMHLERVDGQRVGTRSDASALLQGVRCFTLNLRVPPGSRWANGPGADSGEEGYSSEECDFEPEHPSMSPRRRRLPGSPGHHHSDRPRASGRRRMPESESHSQRAPSGPPQHQHAPRGYLRDPHSAPRDGIQNGHGRGHHHREHPGVWRSEDGSGGYSDGVGGGPGRAHERHTAEQRARSVETDAVVRRHRKRRAVLEDAHDRDAVAQRECASPPGALVISPPRTAARRGGSPPTSPPRANPPALKDRRRLRTASAPSRRGEDDRDAARRRAERARERNPAFFQASAADPDRESPARRRVVDRSQKGVEVYISPRRVATSDESSRRPPASPPPGADQHFDVSVWAAPPAGDDVRPASGGAAGERAAPSSAGTQRWQPPAAAAAHAPSAATSAGFDGSSGGGLAGSERGSVPTAVSAQAAARHGDRLSRYRDAPSEPDPTPGRRLSGYRDAPSEPDPTPGCLSVSHRPANTPPPESHEAPPRSPPRQRPPAASAAVQTEERNDFARGRYSPPQLAGGGGEARGSPHGLSSHSPRSERWAPPPRPCPSPPARPAGSQQPCLQAPGPARAAPTGPTLRGQPAESSWESAGSGTSMPVQGWRCEPPAVVSPTPQPQAVPRPLSPPQALMPPPRLPGGRSSPPPTQPQLPRNTWGSALPLPPPPPHPDPAPQLRFPARRTTANPSAGSATGVVGSDPRTWTNYGSRTTLANWPPRWA